MFRSRWIVFFPAALFALFAPQPAQALQTGLLVRGYSITEVPPIKSDAIYTECNTELENNINRSYDGEPLAGCPDDLFMVHMTGFITIPEHQTIEFWLASDDGGNINIGGNEWGNWGDQGCSAYESGQLQLGAGSQTLDLWMYENGGGTCLMLAWNIDGTGWAIVPDEAFTTTDIPVVTTIPETTTTSTTTTTIPATTSTLGTTTTTSSTTTTAMPTSTTTTSTSPPIPVTQVIPPIETAPPVTEPQTTTTTTTTTTSIPATTIPSTSTIPLSTTSTSPAVTTVETTEPPKTLILDPEVPAPTTAPADLDAPTGKQEGVIVAQMAVSAVLQAFQAENLSPAQASAVFEALPESDLTPAQIEEITEIVQDAPTEIREVFEDTVNVFSAGFNDYVPLGSKISVAGRRAVVAVTAMFMCMPVPIPVSTRRVQI